jgi:nicotinate-nucleotide adenylyltransferase
MRKIGLYFGSFNPITKAHEYVANYVLKQCSIDEIHFVISPQNPQKQNIHMADTAIRVEMVEEVCKQYDNLFINTIELTLPTPSYTDTTLKAIEESFEPNVEYYIIMGYDVFQELHTWHNFKEILKYNIIVLPRNKMYDEEEYLTYVHFLQNCVNTDLNINYLHDMSLLNISSTQVRDAIQKGEPLNNMINEKVLEIINQYKLYQNG